MLSSKKPSLFRFRRCSIRVVSTRLSDACTQPIDSMTAKACDEQQRRRGDVETEHRTEGRDAGVSDDRAAPFRRSKESPFRSKTLGFRVHVRNPASEESGRACSKVHCDGHHVPSNDHGAGKTTVVAPLLALMLAKSDALVVEVVGRPAGDV